MDMKTRTMIRPYAKKSTSKSLEPINLVCGSKYMKEFQRTVFFVACNSITDKQQKQLLYQRILGNGCQDHIYLPEQMVQGMNRFSGLYDDVATNANDDRNASSEGVHHELDKKLNGKLAIYADKADGITKNCYVPRP